MSLPARGFQIHETKRSVDLKTVFRVLRGELAVYRIREFVPAEVCRRIVANFWASQEKVARPGCGDDGVEAYFIGASHIGKTTRQYLEDARDSANAVKSLYAGTIDPTSSFRALLSEGPGAVSRVRPAQRDGLLAGDAKAVYWNNSGRFLLEPHDDYAQTKDPDQKDFEIQQTARVMAVNIYVQVPPGSGQLQVWNVEPDDQTRAELGLTYTGYPYPPELLQRFPSRTVPVETGDLCLLHGNLVHAVLRGDVAVSPRNRLLITCFMTLTGDDEIIWWT